MVPAKAATRRPERRADLSRHAPRAPVPDATPPLATRTTLRASPDPADLAPGVSFEIEGSGDRPNGPSQAHSRFDATRSRYFDFEGMVALGAQAT